MGDILAQNSRTKQFDDLYDCSRPMTSQQQLGLNSTMKSDMVSLMCITALYVNVNVCEQLVHVEALKLNKKTEVMWFGSATNFRKISSVDKDILIGSDIIASSSVVRDLGVFFDSELNMNSHISRLHVLLPFVASARCALPAGTGDNGLSSLSIRFVVTGLLQCSSG